MPDHAEKLKKAFTEVQTKERDKCEKCTAIEQCTTEFKGHYQIVTYPYNDGTPCLQFVKCKHEKTKQAVARMRAALAGSGMGKRFLSRRFDAFNPTLNQRAYDEALAYARNFTSNTQDGLIFMGYVGVGKTHLAAAILHEIIKKGIHPIFVASPDLSLRLSTSWQEGDTRSLSEKVQKAEILFIDDLGKEKNTETINTFIFQTINSRYEDCKPTIITTNLNKAEIKKRYGEAINSRLTEMCKPVVMKGEDYRTRT